MTTEPITDRLMEYMPDGPNSRLIDITRDFILIPRDQLPEVEDQYRPVHVIADEWDAAPTDSPDRLRRHARALLALAEHLEQHPPVDQDQVDALTDLIIEADGTESVTQKLAIRRVARELVKAGVRVEVDQ